MYPQYSRININLIEYIYIYIFLNIIYQNIFFSTIQKLKIL